MPSSYTHSISPSLYEFQKGVIPLSKTLDNSSIDSSRDILISLTELEYMTVELIALKLINKSIKSTGGADTKVSLVLTNITRKINVLKRDLPTQDTPSDD